MSPEKTTVDTIYFNGKIQTVDDSLAVVEALAIKSGLIEAVGTSESIQAKYNAQETIDLRGRHMYPGLMDPHCHFYGYGMTLRNANLTATDSWESVLEAVQLHQSENPTEWVLGRGWDQNDWEDQSYPINVRLNELYPDKPVVLTRIDGHAVIANDVALKMVGFNHETEIEGGELLASDGKLTGLLIDNAADSIKELIPEPTEEEQKNALIQAEKNCFAVGLTSVGDAGLKWKTIRLINELHQSGDLKMRMYTMVESATEDLDTILPKGAFKTDRLYVRSVKIYADGALGSRGALLIEDYSDRPGHKGLLLHSEEEILDIVSLANKHGFQVCTHGIGDGAVRKILALYGQFLEPDNDLRWRIEHSQIVHPDDQELMAQLNVIPSVQSTHATSDMYWAEERIGPDRMKYAYALNDLLSTNGWIPNGSDFPIESINPIFGYYAAVVRKDQKGFPEGGFQKENALSREDALRATTIWAAKAQFQEDETGSIEVGKKADLVVLDRDILSSEERELFNTRVLRTVVAGETVFVK